MIDNAALVEFADTHATSVAAVQALIDMVRARVGAVEFYIFWTRGAATGSGRSTGRPRTLLAFTTPDAALAFAQGSQLSSPAERPRLRRLTLLHLLHAMLQDPAITALIITAEGYDQPIAIGQLPPGMRIDRSELVRRLRETG